MEKIVNPGRGKAGAVFCRIEYDDGRLSITGVVGPMRNGDAKGSCGQIVGHLTDDVQTFEPGWDAALLARFAETWARWHLNDMRPGCEHQRDGYGSAELDVVSYKLTTDAHRMREAAIRHAATAAARGEAPNLTDTARALILLADWFKPCFTPPEADSPLSGCYQVDKRETKRAGWVYPTEHPRGVLTKACDVCGYKYGSAWKKEAIPDDVLSFLFGLPETTVTPAWV